MCVIIVKPKGGILTRKTAKEAFRCNSHGAGLMFADKGKLYIHRGFWGFRKFWAVYGQYYRAHPNATFVIHMRIASSGKINVDNCHPFQVQDNAGFCHNGVMSKLADSEHSDTYNFVHKILNKLPPNFWHEEKIISTIEKVADESHSKFVLCDNMGFVRIFNESAGHWRAGCWYSNQSYLIPSYTFSVLGSQEDSFEKSMLSYAKASINRTHHDTHMVQLNTQHDEVPAFDSPSVKEALDALDALSHKEAVQTVTTPVVTALATTPEKTLVDRTLEEVGARHVNTVHLHDAKVSSTCFWCRTLMDRHEFGRTFFRMGTTIDGIDIHNQCFRDMCAMIQLTCPECRTHINIPPRVMWEQTISCEFCNYVMNMKEVVEQLTELYNGAE